MLSKKIRKQPVLPRGKDFWHNIEQMWVSHYTLGSEQASMECRKPGETTPQKNKTFRFVRNIFVTIFFGLQRRIARLFSLDQMTLAYRQNKSEYRMLGASGIKVLVHPM